MSLLGARTLSPLFLVVAAGIIGSRRRLIRRLQRAGATSQDAAAEVGTGRLLTRWWLARLGSAGVVHSTGGERYWLDPSAWQRYQAVRRRRALVMVLGVLLLAAVVFLRNRQ